MRVTVDERGEAELSWVSAKNSQGLPPSRYEIDGGRICLLKRDAEGNVFSDPLCNFQATITKEVVHDDGAETTAFFQIAGSLHDGTALPSIDVRADEFQAMEWVLENWGARAIVLVGPSFKDHLRTAIQELSGKMPRAEIFAHTGWRKINSNWGFLHAGGAINGDGNVADIAVQLPAALQRFHLPQQLGDPIAAVRKSLALLDNLVSDRIIFPLYAAIWCAVLGQTDLSVSVNGLTGTFKSEIASLIQRHFGSKMDSRHLPANWLSTANSLEGIAHAAKDVIMVCDDFCPPGSSAEAARYHAKADQLLRAAGNGSGRQRMRADTSLRPEKPPRALIFSTGEDSPRGQSLQARMMQIDMAKGDVNVERLTACQNDADCGIYAEALAGFVRWLSPQYEKIQEGLRGEIGEARSLSFRAGQHRRTASIVAELTVALSWFLSYAFEIGALRAGEVSDYQARCQEALEEAAAKQTHDQGAEESTGKFLQLLAASISSGKAHIAAGTDGRAPGIDKDPESALPAGWGWRRDYDEWRALGTCVGWLDGDDLYLEPHASFAAAATLARDQGEGLAISPRTLRKRLRDKNLIATVESERGVTVRRTLAGLRRAVLHLKAETLHNAGSLATDGMLTVEQLREGLDLS
jgi:hypothetical protein